MSKTDQSLLYNRLCALMCKAADLTFAYIARSGASNDRKVEGSGGKTPFVSTRKSFVESCRTFIAFKGGVALNAACQFLSIMVDMLPSTT